MSKLGRQSFLTLLLLFCTAQESLAVSSYLDDIELRTEYDFSDDTYRSKFRLEFNLNKNKFKYTDYKASKEKNALSHLRKKSELSSCSLYERAQVSSMWKKSLRKEYKAYLKMTASNPSKQDLDLEIEVQKVLMSSNKEEYSCEQ